jgi:hypothetical protein
MRSVNSEQRRPGRGWFAVAGAVALLGLVAAAVVLIVGIRSWTDEFPTLGAPVRSGEAVQAELRANQPAVLYVSPDTSTSEWRCTGDVAGSPVAVSEAPYTFTFFSGGRTWAARYEIRADRAGVARLTCSAVPGSGSLLAVGEQPDNARLVRKLVTTIVAGACVGLFGLGLGGTIAVLVRKRRKKSVPAPGSAWPPRR